MTPSPAVDPNDVQSCIAVWDTTSLNATVRTMVQAMPPKTPVLLYVPSQGRNSKWCNQASIDSIHTRLGRALGLRVAHGGAVFAQLQRTHPTLRQTLFLPDGSHQSTLGAYLEALTLVARWIDRPVTGLTPPALPGLTDSLTTEFQQAAQAAAAMRP